MRRPSSWPAPRASLPVAGAILFLSFAAGIATAGWLLHQSTGAPLDDEIGHYLVARDAWHDPRFLLNIWGRSLNTLIYVVPAALGLTATRWFSIALTAAAIGLACRLGRHLGLRHAYLVAPFAWFQRWTLELSHTCLTEIPFMLFLVWGLERFAAGRLAASGLALGSLPLIRHEGIALVGLWALYAAVTQRWRLLAALAIPGAIYNLVSFAVEGTWPFTIFFVPKPTDAYGSGGWLHFAPLMLMFAGKPVAVLALLGFPLMLRTRERCATTLTFAAYLLVHVVVFRFGLFASGGYAEFLVPLAPGLALAAAVAVDWTVRTRAAQATPGSFVLSLARTATIAGLVAAVMLTGWHSSHAVALRPIETACLRAAAWMRGQRLDRRPIVATNVWFYHALPLRVTDPLELWTRPAPLEQVPAGGIVVWDNKYSNLWGLPLEMLSGDRSRWRRRAVFGPDGEVMVFERMQ